MTPQEHYHNEAEIVAWSEVTINGWKINVTARQGATSQAIVSQVLELGEALKTLRERYGAQPYQNGNGCHTKAANAALAAATPAPGPHPTPDDEAWNAMQSATSDPAVQAALARAKQNGYPPAGARPQPQPQAPTLANGAEDPGYCKIHGCAMKRHEKDSQVWYSHKAPDGTWCRGKRKDPPSLGY